jgi:predicted transcriptional regulator
MNATLKSMLPVIEAWPSEDQDQLAEAARDIEARRLGRYHATQEELEGIDAGLADLRAGRLASAEAVAAMHARLSSG